MLRKTLIAAAIVALTPAFAAAVPATKTAKPVGIVHAMKAGNSTHLKHHKGIVRHKVGTQMRLHKATTTKS